MSFFRDDRPKTPSRALIAERQVRNFCCPWELKLADLIKSGRLNLIVEASPLALILIASNPLTFVVARSNLKIHFGEQEQWLDFIRAVVVARLHLVAAS